MIGPDSPNPLIAERQPLLSYMGCSVLFHLGALASAWLGGSVIAGVFLFVPFCQPEPPKQSIEVAVYSALPKSRLNVPDRPSQAPKAVGKESPVKEPPPVKQSDLVIHKPEPEPEGNTEEAKRQELLAQIERNRAVQDLLDAPEGKVDRMQTDPNGVEGLETAVLGAAAQGDPEFARWVGQVQRLMMSHFRPLTQGKDLRCWVKVRVDSENGNITSWEVTTSSGEPAFDSAAEGAITSVGTLPLPPEKYRPLLDEGVAIEFLPPR